MSRINPVARHAAPQVRKHRSDPRPAELRKTTRKKQAAKKHIGAPEETKCVFGPSETKGTRAQAPPPEEEMGAENEGNQGNQGSEENAGHGGPSAEQ